MSLQCNPLSMKIIKGMMEPIYQLTHLTIGDDLDNQHELLLQCIKQHDDAPLRQRIDDLYSDSRVMAMHGIMDRIEQQCRDAGYDKSDVDDFFTHHGEEIGNEIFTRDTDFDITRALLERTLPIPIRVEFHSKYDCINSHSYESMGGGYTYRESYFGDMVDALNLNPSRLKWRMTQMGIRTSGNYPCLKERNGKELVGYESLCRELTSSHTPENLLVFMATLDPVELYKQHFDLARITVPAGNRGGLFSPWSGGGSQLRMELLRPLEIILTDKAQPFALAPDIDNDVKMSIRRVYGDRADFFGNTLSIAA